MPGNIIFAAATLMVVATGLWKYRDDYKKHGRTTKLGCVLCGNSTMAFLGVVLYWVVVHLTILIEEEHLTRAYGDAYQEYKSTTPRYLFC